MSYEDPFDNIPDENVKEVVPVAQEPTVIKTEAVGDGEGKIVHTFKEGAGFDASWTVVHAVSLDDSMAILNDPKFKAVLDQSKKVAAYYRGGPVGGAGRPAAPAQQSGQQNAGLAPQAAQEAPGGEKRFCSHGEMQFKSGVSKQGKAYKLFSCTAPRDQQCKAQFLN